MFIDFLTGEEAAGGGIRADIMLPIGLSIRIKDILPLLLADAVLERITLYRLIKG
jgi:hypothetical protein